MYADDLAVPGFYDYVKSMGQRYGFQPLDMLGVWMSESGVRANAHNPNGHASGINQLMPPIAAGLGWQRDDALPPDPLTHIPLTNYRALNPLSQLPWIARYYAPYAGKMTSPSRCYLATFLPALLSDPTLNDQTVLAQKNGKLGWAYSANAIFDENNDLKIQLFELGDAITRNCHGGRWNEIVTNTTGQPAPVVTPVDFDLGTIRGVEQALAKLNYYNGAIDGLMGPMLHHALQVFQLQHPPLTADGIYGPKTRAALSAALGNP
jgi:hypothetical protein